MALIEFKDLPDTTTPLNAENLNNNFEYLENLNKYSTSEQVIGKWINGKPIYRKVVQGTYDLRTLGAHFFPTGISNVAQLINLTYELDGSLYDLTYNSAISAIGLDTSNNVYMYTNVNWDNNLSFTFIIEYTKTTD